MRKNKRKIYSTAIAAAVIVIVMILAACTTTADSVQATFWGLVPPIIAIGLALLTKEVYSSLFIGILAGALLYTGFNVEDTVNHVFFRRHCHRPVGYRESGDPGIPGNSGNHGKPHEQGGRLRRFRALGVQKDQNPGGRAAGYRGSGSADFY